MNPRTAIILLTLILSPFHPARAEVVPDDLRELSENGGWCWFQGERALLLEDTLVVGAVADDLGPGGADRQGNVEALIHDIKTKETSVVVLDKNLEDDDHDVPAFYRRDDGRLLAMWSKHIGETEIRYRITQGADPQDWQPLQRLELPEEYRGTTYTNIYKLRSGFGQQGRLFCFFRSHKPFTPHWAYSDDDGNSWEIGGELLTPELSGRQRPYVRYASTDRDVIHLAFTEAHPLEYPRTSIYYAQLNPDGFCRADGTIIKPFAEAPLVPSEAMLLFQGDEDHVAWVMDVRLNSAEHPAILYSVRLRGGQRDPNAVDRAVFHYRLSTWDGKEWHDCRIAHAGTHLYDDQVDYTGLGAIDPGDVNTVYISTNVDPTTGDPCGTRRHEIYRGRADSDGIWQWTAITADSSVSNLRPIVTLPNERGQRALLWLRGEYETYRDYRLKVVAVLLPPVENN